MMPPRATRPDLARRLRANLTDAELRLWLRIRRRQLFGWRFRRQVPIGRFVADFARIEAKLLVEVDGGQHDWRQEQDGRRTAWLEAHGWRVLRFWNNDVMQNIDGVLERLAEELGARGEFPLPNPPPQAGEGISENVP